MNIQPTKMPSIITRTPKAKQHDKFYDTKTWKQTRISFFALPENVPCRECKKKGLIVIAFILDHILPRRWFPELEFTPSNFQGLCRHCDSKKRWLEKGIMSREHAYVVLKDYLNK